MMTMATRDMILAGGFLDWWPRICRFIFGNRPSRESWPSLPAGGGVYWRLRSGDFKVSKP
jgi:hypothetical protein